MLLGFAWSDVFTDSKDKHSYEKFTSLTANSSDLVITNSNGSEVTTTLQAKNSIARSLPSGSIVGFSHGPLLEKKAYT